MTAIVYGTNGISITASSANLTVNSIAITMISGSNTLVMNTSALVIGNTTSNTNLVSKIPFVDGTTRCSTAATLGYSCLSLTNTQTFTSSGTWVKPAASKFVLVRAWGAGGSGGANTPCCGFSRATGGGGGAFNEVILGAGCVTSNVTVTVGAGGNAVSAPSDGFSGGSSTFGSYATAQGGAGGGKFASTIGVGGVTGGVNDKLFMAYTSGFNVSNTATNTVVMATNTGFISAASNYRGFSANSSLYNGSNGVLNNANNTVFGGGAGAGYICGTYYSAGISTYGGNGGNVTSIAGKVPGGGGASASASASGSGGNGQIIVYVYS